MRQLLGSPDERPEPDLLPMCSHERTGLSLQAEPQNRFWQLILD